MDSVCAINIGGNPAARCQYCGTSSAGTPPENKKLRNVSVGQSSSNTISEKELKDAPTEPQMRYAWAAAQCIQKISGCTVDDVSDNYDKLIEQSCTAAGVSAQLAGVLTQAHAAKTAGVCETEILSCLITDGRCGADYAACKEDAVFDRNLSECAVDATGCDSFMANIRTTLIANRDTAVKNADAALDGIIAAYQKKRTERFTTILNQCQDNKSRDECVATVCATNMPNQCGDGFASERASATLMCKFHQLACDKMKSKTYDTGNTKNIFN